MFGMRQVTPKVVFRRIPTPKHLKPGVSQAGFSLVEIIISLVILSILLLSLGMMFTRGRGYIKGQGDRRVALTLAEGRLEEIGTITFSELEDLDVTTGDSWIYTKPTENPPSTTFDCTTPPCEPRLDGNSGRPDYSYYNCQTILEYVEVNTNATGFQVDPCSGYPCNYIRTRVRVSLTDAQKATGNRGYFEDVTLETIISDWAG